LKKKPSALVSGASPPKKKVDEGNLGGKERKIPLVALSGLFGRRRASPCGALGKRRTAGCQIGTSPKEGEEAYQALPQSLLKEKVLAQALTLVHRGKKKKRTGTQMHQTKKEGG